jgi:hypothetical protein
MTSSGGADVATLRAVAFVAQPPHEPAHARAMRVVSHPASAVGPENPKPAREGATTWKASAGSPPRARGSVSGPSRSRNSTTEPGQPVGQVDQVDQVGQVGQVVLGTSIRKGTICSTRSRAMRPSRRSTCPPPGEVG